MANKSIAIDRSIFAFLAVDHASIWHLYDEFGLQPVMKVSRPVSVSRPIFSGLGLEHIFVVLVSRCCGLGLVRSKLVSRPACFLIHHANLLAVF